MVMKLRFLIIFTLCLVFIFSASVLCDENFKREQYCVNLESIPDTNKKNNKSLLSCLDEYKLGDPISKYATEANIDEFYIDGNRCAVYALKHFVYLEIKPYCMKIYPALISMDPTKYKGNLDGVRFFINFGDEKSNDSFSPINSYEPFLKSLLINVGSKYSPITEKEMAETTQEGYDIKRKDKLNSNVLGFSRFYIDDMAGTNFFYIYNNTDQFQKFLDSKTQPK